MGPRWWVQVAGSHTLQLARPSETCRGTAGGDHSLAPCSLHQQGIVPLVQAPALAEKVQRSPDCSRAGHEAVKPSVHFGHATWSCAGEVWDVAGGSLAAARAKQLSKAWECASADQRIDRADNRPAW